MVFDRLPFNQCEPRPHLLVDSPVDWGKLAVRESQVGAGGHVGRHSGRNGHRLKKTALNR